MKKIFLFLLIVFFPLLVFAQDDSPPGVFQFTNEQKDAILDGEIVSPLIAVSTNTLLTATQMKSSIVVLTGDGTVLTLADSDDTSTGSCIRVRVGDATAKEIDVSIDDVDHFELNGVDMTASYAIAIAAGNQGKEIRICDEGGTNEFIAKGDLEFTDSGAD